MLKLLVLIFIINQACAVAWERFKANTVGGQCNLNVSGCSQSPDKLCCGSNYQCGKDNILFWGSCDPTWDYSVCDSPKTNPCYMDTSSKTRTALQDLKQFSGYMNQPEFNTMSFKISDLWFSSSLILSMGVGINNNLNDHNNEMIIKSMSFPTLTESFPASFKELDTITALTIVPTASIEMSKLMKNLPTNLESLTFSGNKIIGTPSLDLGTLFSLKKLQITNTLISGSFESVRLPNSLTQISINYNSRLIGTVPTDFYNVASLDLQYNMLYGPVNSKKFPCYAFNNNCIGTVTDYCSPTTKTLSECKCSAYSNDSTKCMSLNAEKLCDYNQNASECRDFVDCTKQVSHEQCYAVGKCTWCGHSCIESTDVCPLCTDYGENNCSGAIDPGSVNQENCKACVIGQKFHQCVSYDTVCPGCSAFFKKEDSCKSYKACKYCETSGYCVDSEESCPTCYGYTEAACNTDNNCNWCDGEGIINECRINLTDTCRKDCSKLGPSNCDHDDCLNCGTSCIQKGEKCPECTTHSNRETCNQSKGPSGQCVYCGNVCASSVSACPPCKDYKAQTSCSSAVDRTETNEIKKLCHWCGSNMGCLTDKNACPSCNTYTIKNDCDESENPSCFFCPLANTCIDKTGHCNYPSEYKKLFALLKECKNIHFSENNYTDEKDRYKLCTDFKEKNFQIDCTADFSAFDTIKLVNAGMSSLTAINNFPARVINVSQNDFGGKLDALVLDFDTVKQLYLSNNKFEGSIPADLTPSEVLDLSNNKLTGDVPSIVVSSVKKLEIKDNLLTGYIGNCKLYEQNCFMDTGEGCDMKTLNGGCDCSVFASSEEVCNQISFCEFVSREEEKKDEQGHVEIVTINECVRREVVEGDKSFPTYAIVLIVVGVLVVVAVGIVLAVVLTRRKKEYSSSSSSSIVETELDSQTGARVTF